MAVLRSTRVVLPDGVRPAAIHIENGIITRVAIARLKGSRSGNDDSDDVPERSATRSGERDLGDLVISPGLVDTHVHVNEPGRTEWEGFDTATRAAAAGGVTTIVDMPLNSVPATTTTAALEAKRAAARGRVHVDVAFWGGVVPGNAGALEALADAGARGFKCFLSPSGVAEFPHVGERDLREALPILARLGMPLLVHAEDAAVIAECGMRNAEYQTANAESGIADALGVPRSDPRVPPSDLRIPHSAFRVPHYSRYLASRPPEAERVAVDLLVRLAREFGAHVHIVHVASAEAAAAIAGAKAAGVRITAETCPHYLTFAAEDIGDGATEFKCAPPIRDARQRDALWDALQSGTLDLVATDHSPAPPAMKCGGDFFSAWGGIASLELSLAAVFAGLDVIRRLQPGDRPVDPAALRRIARWMSEAPADLAALGARKGRIAAGCDADFVIWDPDAEWTVEPSRLQQRHKLTPYAGRRLRGAVHETWVRGRRVWRGGALDHGCEGELL